MWERERFKAFEQNVMDDVADFVTDLSASP